VADGVHEHGERGEGAAVVEAQHFHAGIVRPVGVQAHDGAAIDDFAAVDTEADLVLAIAHGDGAQSGGGGLGGGGDLVDDLVAPAQILGEAGGGVVVRGGDEDVRGGDAGLFFDAGAHFFHEVFPGADDIHGDDGGAGLAVVEHQHAGPQGIAGAIDLAAVASDPHVARLGGGDIHFGGAGFEV
jgi:hypothetical protein